MCILNTRSPAKNGIQNQDSTTSTPNTGKTCVQNALATALKGVGFNGAMVAPTSILSYPSYGHINETDLITFASSADAANFQLMSGRNGLISSTVSEYGFGPGVRFPGGLHSENGVSINALQIQVASHIDMFGANGGLAPLIGHALVDVAWGHILTWIHGHQQASLDRGC